jgi:hypothetical protein
MDSQEISLRDMAAKTWRLRGPIAAILLLALLLAGFWVLKTAASFRSPVTYFITLRNIEGSKFPNGTEFSPRDLLIPQVAGALRKRFDIPETAKLDDFVSVEYGSPIAAAVSEKYNNRLAARGLGQTEIDAINQAYQLELQKLMSSGLRIDVDYSGLGVDKQMGKAIAVAIPQIWSEIYSRQFRIFADTRLSGAAVTFSDEKLDSPASVLIAKKRLDSIDEGLALLSADNRLAGLATRDDKSVADVMTGLERFRTVYFNPIFAESDDDGDRVSAIYRRERHLTIEDWKRRIAGLDRNLADLRDSRNSGRATAGWNAAAGAADAKGDVQNVQLADGALGQIIDLTNRASLADYMKTVLDQRQTMVERISRLQKEVDLTGSAADGRVPPQFREAAAAELSKLTAEYQELLVTARRRMAETAGELYIPLAPPEVAGSWISLRSLLAFPILLIAGAIISVLMVLLWPERRQRPLVAAMVPDMRIAVKQ